MSSNPIVRCSAAGPSHPGFHRQTHTCVDPRLKTAGERFSAWLERKLNPKQGHPGPTCSNCENALLTLQGRCVYCENPYDSED